MLNKTEKTNSRKRQIKIKQQKEKKKKKQKKQDIVQGNPVFSLAATECLEYSLLFLLPSRGSHRLAAVIIDMNVDD